MPPDTTPAPATLRDGSGSTVTLSYGATTFIGGSGADTINAFSGGPNLLITGNFL